MGFTFILYIWTILLPICATEFLNGIRIKTIDNMIDVSGKGVKPINSGKDATFRYSPDSVVLKQYEEMDPMVPTPGYTCFTIFPTLPSGLCISEEGIITGIPLQTMTSQTFTVMAFSQSQERETTTITVSVENAVLDFKYNPSEVMTRKGESMNVMIPTSGYYSFSIQPALPTGVELRYDGVIWGTPTELLKRTEFTVVAHNLDDRKEATIVVLSVIESPSPLLYHPDTIVVLKDIRIMPLTPTLNYHNFTVTPTLPDGLVIEEDGMITGTPHSIQQEMNFTVIGYAEDDTVSSTTVTITVIDEFHYEPNSIHIQLHQFLLPQIPSAKLHTFIINPSLPPGLTIDTSTGIIQGTPTQLSPETVYTVHASASGPMTSTTITLCVEENNHPFVYTPASDILYQNEPMTPMNPSSGFFNFSITPSLPTGLVYSENGTVSGTPTELLKRTEFTVVAQNEEGEVKATTITLIIQKKDQPLKYYPDTIVVLKDIRIMPLTPTLNYHNFTVTPTLPDGLVIEEDGMITGTPHTIQQETVFVIYAYTDERIISSTTVTITVIDEFHYDPNKAFVSIHHPLPPLKPSAKLHTFTINPSLPPGLTIDTSTGIIQGTPTRLSPETVYTVHASASGPMTSTTVTITVKENASIGMKICILTICTLTILCFIILVIVKLRKLKRDEPLLSSV